MDASDFEDVRLGVRGWVRDRVLPRENEIEEKDAIPEDLRQQAKDMGLFGFALPEAHGGLGLSMEEEARLVMELGYTSPAVRSMFGTNNGIAGHVVMLSGSPEQQASWLPKLASGEVTASFALTEAEAGSDPSSLRTRAVRTPAGWAISGEKRYITNAPIADVFMVFARTDPASTGGRGISVFLVPASTTGVTVGPKDHKMGQAGAWTSDVHFDAAVVPDDALIGVEGEGYKTALGCLAHGRIHIAALCCGLAERLVDETVAYAATREQGGHPIGEYQLIQGLIADSQTEAYAGRAAVLEAARDYDSGRDRRVAPSAAKYFASEMVGRVADRAVQVHGGAGYMRGVPVERFFRDARLFRIYEGTSQVQQVIIAGHLLRAARA